MQYGANKLSWFLPSVNRLLKRACFEKCTIKIILVFAWFFRSKRLFQQPVRPLVEISNTCFCNGAVTMSGFGFFGGMIPAIKGEI